MRKLFFIFFLCACTLLLHAQISFTTIVSRKPLVAGESFQVQYILENADKPAIFKAPLYPDFRFVSGPHVYSGTVMGSTGRNPVQNAVFTLEAIRKGSFTVPGAVAIINGVSIRSNDVDVIVLSPAEVPAAQKRLAGQGASGFFLGSGEDPQEKIRKNIFLRVLVNKRTCYVGEPVMATFKLFSRLESRSDIVKNPGFYGFTVIDMISLDDNQTKTEMLQGELFDVHTIRQVQLYPLQAGLYTIDALQVKNKILFSDSQIDKKAEQEIREGILGNQDTFQADENTRIYENEISTDPVYINVKPLPAKSIPADYSGATGQFSILAAPEKNELARNEEGIWVVSISGSGNFTQLPAPLIHWPKGIEGYDPVFIDSLDKQSFPLKGTRSFRYPFSVSAPGVYEFPEMEFSYFDPALNNYVTLRTTPYRVKVSNLEKKPDPVSFTRRTSFGNKTISWWAAGIIVLFVLASLVYWTFRKTETEQLMNYEVKPVWRPAEEFLQKAQEISGSSNPEFYRAMQQAVILFVAQFIDLPMNEGKEVMLKKLKARGLASDELDQLRTSLEEWERAIYTGINTKKPQMEWLQELASLLNSTGNVLVESK